MVKQKSLAFVLNYHKSFTHPCLWKSSLFGIDCKRFHSDKSNADAQIRPRQLFVFRHGERVDFTFGKWIPNSFDESGNYIRTDINMPVTLPVRADGPNDFSRDSPLTNIGLHQATLTGEALKEHGVKFVKVFSSPALRCIQTCTNILKASGHSHLKIQVEPGLFEWLGWYKDGLPKWMTPQEFQDYGFNVCCRYKPTITTEKLLSSEDSVEEYYLRSFAVTKEALKSTLHEGGNILFVGHAATVETCTSQLVGKQPKPTSDLLSFSSKVPYCSVAVAKEDVDGTWSLMEPPTPPVTHSSNAKYDWKMLIT